MRCRFLPFFRTHSPPRSGHHDRPVLLVAATLVLAHMATLVALARITGETVDEPVLLASGRAVLTEGWNDRFTCLQGPLPLYANQIFTRGQRGEGSSSAQALFLGRLGLLPFALISAGVLFTWALLAFGASSALLALALWAANPMMLAYGSLLAVDAAHTALVLLALFLAWRSLERPDLIRILPAGLALGCALATKYLALLFAPIAAVAILLGSWRTSKGHRARARLARAATAGLLFGAFALLALHASYGFRPGFAPRDPAAYGSEILRRWIDWPGIGHALALLPRPFLQGLDLQFSTSLERIQTFFNGRFAEGHPGYYLGALAWKTPELLFVALAAAALVALARARREESAARTTWIFALAAIALPLLYLSFFNKRQIGIRYALPIYPLLFLLAGSALRAIPRRLTALVVTLIVVLGAAEAASRWPHLLGYYNRTSGGPALAWKRFTDSNSDWGDLEHRGLEILRVRASRPFAVLNQVAGPRFGRVALHVSQLAPRDPRDPSRAYTWLHPFTPVRHVGAAWFLFEIDPVHYAQIAASAPDPRVRRDFALALLGAGERDAAFALRAALSAEEISTFERLGELAHSPGDDPLAHALESARLWSSLNREDLALAALQDERVAATPEGRAAIVETLLRAQKLRAAIEVIEASPELQREERFVLLLFELLRDVARFTDAVTWMEPRLKGLSPQLRPIVERELATLHELIEQGRRIYKPR